MRRYFFHLFKRESRQPAKLLNHHTFPQCEPRSRPQHSLHFRLAKKRPIPLVESGRRTLHDDRTEIDTGHLATDAERAVRVGRYSEIACIPADVYSLNRLCPKIGGAEAVDQTMPFTISPKLPHYTRCES